MDIDDPQDGSADVTLISSLNSTSAHFENDATCTDISLTNYPSKSQKPICSVTSPYQYALVTISFDALSKNLIPKA